MSIHLLVAFLGCVIAAVGTVMLALRFSRAPRIVAAAWALALLGLTVSLGAQALGHHSRFGPGTFRAMELGGQVLAPLALSLGLAEVAGRLLPARFAARLILPALGLIAFVILGTDPLTTVAFTAASPEPAVYYQLIPVKLLEYGLVPVTVLVALIAVGVTAARARRDRAWRAASLPVWAAGAAVLALALPGVAVRLGIAAPVSSLFAVLCLAAAILTWFAGIRIGRVQLALLRDSAPDPAELADNDWDQAESWGARYDETGDFEAADGRGIYRGNGLYRPGSGYDQGEDAQGYAADGVDPDYTGEIGYTGEIDYRSDDGYSVPVPLAGPGGAGSGGARSGGADAAGIAAAGALAGAPAANGRGDSWYPAGNAERTSEPGRRPAQLAEDHEARERLFGQIAIYTLFEDRVEEFDRLTERVVEQVRGREPDTLVYIVHAVPSAPMQRILYEVYRDRAAYHDHKLQPYIARFEADLGPLVLATNVIELGLQQAKVSPFPSIADLFGEPGFDTSGFERPDYRETGYGRPSAGYGDALGSPR
jgi:quinol monooxygenase YgiN